MVWGQERRRTPCARQDRDLHTRLAGLVKHCKSSKAAWDLKSYEESKETAPVLLLLLLFKSL